VLRAPLVPPEAPRPWRVEQEPWAMRSRPGGRAAAPVAVPPRRPPCSPAQRGPAIPFQGRRASPCRA